MKKILVATGTRAEYGLLRPLIKRLKEDDDLKIQIVVTGTHLSPEFGLTYKEIEADGFEIDEKIEILLSSDTPIGISKSMGLAMISFSEVLNKLKPNIVIILGDRYEMLAIASSSLIATIPIVHIHGGEAGSGTIDNMIRHSITKMSLIHFTSTETYRKRVIQLGENPNNVYNVGSLGVENIKELDVIPRDKLEEDLNFKIDDKTILFTFHPLSLEYNLAEDQINQILQAFDNIENLRIIFTKCNSDTGGKIINKKIDEYVLNNPNKAVSFLSLGATRYLNTARYVKAVVGNSSSGIIEIPSLSTYTLNIGKRQDGRIQSESIINCEPTVEDVYEKLSSILKKTSSIKSTNPYEKENTSLNMLNILKKRILELETSEKKFYDINF